MTICSAGTKDNEPERIELFDKETDHLQPGMAPIRQELSMRLTIIAAIVALMPLAAFAQDQAPTAATAAPQAIQADSAAPKADKPHPCPSILPDSFTVMVVGR